MKSNTFVNMGLKLFSAVFLFTVLSSTTSAAGPTSAEYGVVLNLSGKQRMLSQKMSKEVILIALETDTVGNLDNLKKTSSLFDKTLTGLRNGSEAFHLPPTSSKRILRQLDKIDDIWADFYPIVKTILANKSVSKEQVEIIAAKNLPLLKAMNKGVGLYEKDAKKGGLKAAPGLASTLNLSGKQRMLTQKMSKEFLMVAYGHEVENNKLNLLETYTLFERTLKGLRDGDETLSLPGTQSQHILDQLSVVENLWTPFKLLVESGAEFNTSSIPKGKVIELAKSNLPLLREMNKAVGMYAKEADK